MKTGPECAACLGILAERIAKVTAQTAPSLHGPSLKLANEVLTARNLLGRTVPTRIATRMLRAVKELSGNPDPFSLAKEAEFLGGQSAAQRLRPLFGSDVASLLALSALGNQIDFFRELSDVEKLWDKANSAPSLDDTPRFTELLQKPANLLFLADNTGEVPFDLPLLEKLSSLGHSVTYAVKGKPSQNDITAADLKRFGIAFPHIVDTGTDWVGCEFKAVGKGFRSAWERCDLVLSKGMANLETITEYPEMLETKRVFFALMVKCAPVAAFLGLPLGRPAILDGARLARP